MIDTEKFRLRHFVEKLVQQGECVVHDDPIDLIDVAAVLDCNPRAVWFRAVGPEKAELVGNVMGTRRRLAAALDTDEPGFPTALRERLRHPVAPIEVFAVCCTASSGGMYNVRASLRQRNPGEARNAIAAVFCSSGDVKHVFVVDDDIDVFSDEQIDWALATRFQADRDFVVASGFRCVPLDPSLQGSRTGAKAGFDCTKPFGKGDSAEFTVPHPPKMLRRPRQTLEAALAEGPATYLELMAALGTRDGREILRDFDQLYQQGRLKRLQDGRYALNGGA